MDGISLKFHRARGAVGVRILLLVPIVLAVGLQPAAAAAPPPGQSVELWGRVEGPAGTPLPGARVQAGENDPVVTDEQGRFALSLAPGGWTISVRHSGFETLEQRVELPAEGLDSELVLVLGGAPSLRESVTVVGIRADSETPVSKSDLDRDRLQELYAGQDVPEILEVTPSVTSYSDSGSGSNYSYFSLRGIQQTRINVTLDGAPLNDPAEHALFFNNFHGFAGAVDSIQVQRGVGISSVGTPSFGGSVNFVSSRPRREWAGDAEVVLGSYATRRASVGVQSGLLGGGFSLGGRFSYSDTDGYRDHSGSEHDTIYLNGGWQDARSSLRLTAFSGNEQSQMAFLAVEPEVLAENPRVNPLDPAERDDFGQDFAQLKYTRETGPDDLLTASLYYNGAAGSFFLRDDPVAQSALLDFGIDQHFWGSMLTYSVGGERSWASVGIHYNDFSGDHSLAIGPTLLYRNNGAKQTFNAFAKAELRAGDTLLFGDLGLRHARFAYTGDVDLGSIDWLSVDPRIGVRHWLAEPLSLYVSLGRAQREPARLDLLAGEDNATVRHDLEAVRPESVVDLEAGIGFRSGTLSLHANLYAMELRDEIALTGELSEIGLPLRRNVESSYRRGIEVDLRWRPRGPWSLWHTLNLSRNRIASWTQFYDVYDPGFAWVDSRPITHHDVRPLLSPERIANLGVEWQRGDLTLALAARHVGPSQLDNTDDPDLRIPAYTRLDARASIDLADLAPAFAPRLRIWANNLLDEVDHYASGYSYPYFVRDDSGAETLFGSAFYYPRADRNLSVALELGF